MSERNRPGGHPPSTRVGPRPTPLGAPPCLVGHLAGLRCPSLAIWCLLPWKKIRRKLSGRNTATTRRNLGGTNLGLRWSCSAGETSLREGEIIAIDPLSGRVSISINIFTSTISSPNPSSSLVSNSCLQVRDWC